MSLWVLTLCTYYLLLCNVEHGRTNLYLQTAVKRCYLSRYIVRERLTDRACWVLSLKKAYFNLPALCLLQKLFLKGHDHFPLLSLLLIVLNLAFFTFLHHVITLLCCVHKISKHAISLFPFLLA